MNKNLVHNKLPWLGTKQHFLIAIVYQYIYEHRTSLGAHKLNKNFLAGISKYWTRLLGTGKAEQNSASITLFSPDSQTASRNKIPTRSLWEGRIRRGSILKTFSDPRHRSFNLLGKRCGFTTGSLKAQRGALQDRLSCGQSFQLQKAQTKISLSSRAQFSFSALYHFVSSSSPVACLWRTRLGDFHIMRLKEARAVSFHLVKSG